MSGLLLRRLLLAALTGLGYPLCFPSFDLGLLAWIVLVPLHLAIEGMTLRRACLTGWLAGWIAFIGTMSWVVNSMHLYGKMPLAPAYAVMGLLTAYLALFVAGYALGLQWLRRRLPCCAFLAAPFLWVTLEWVRTHLFSGLPWVLLGYSQYQTLPIIQIADHTSVYGVSFLVVLVNVALTELALWVWKRGDFSRAGKGDRHAPDDARGEPVPVPWLTPALAVLAVLGAFSYGTAALKAAPVSPAMLQIGLVQANIDQARKWDAAFRRESLDRYERLTAAASTGADLVVWPEAATPFLFEREVGYRTEIVQLVRSHQVPLILGSPTVRFYPDGRPYLLNSAYVLNKDGEIVGRYDKRHLVPFGEYIPLRPLLFFLEKLVVGIGDFERGTGPALLTVPASGASMDPGRPLRFGMAICYEVIFPDLVRHFVQEGADVMVTITNDAWFGHSAAPYQHFGMVVLRAVENRVAFARAANTGISGFIDPYGHILQATPIFEELAVTGSIPYGRAETFYTRYGDLFAYSCAIIAGIFFAATLWPRRR